MNERTNTRANTYYDFNRAVEARFSDMLRVAEDIGYSVYIQHCCINVFGHSKFSLLTAANMEKLMVEAEPIIYDAAIQLRLLK